MEEFLDIVNIWIPESLSTNICYLAADFVRRLFGVEVRCYFRGSVVCEFNTGDASPNQLPSQVFIGERALSNPEPPPMVRTIRQA